VTGATFADSRVALDALLPNFCPELTGATQVPIEGIAPQRAPDPPGMRKKETKPFVPPPPRP
jgi:hypothetical protein